MISKNYMSAADRRWAERYERVKSVREANDFYLQAKKERRTRTRKCVANHARYGFWAPEMIGGKLAVTCHSREQVHEVVSWLVQRCPSDTIAPKLSEIDSAIYESGVTVGIVSRVATWFFEGMTEIVLSPSGYFEHDMYVVDDFFDHVPISDLGNISDEMDIDLLFA